jgi:Uma2 family endonuclease
MASSVQVSVDEYLSSMYHPDCDFVDGELKERNLGDEPHAEIQAILARIMGNHRMAWAVRVLTEVRIQTTEKNFRIPDVCLVDSSQPRGRVIRYAPLLCVEILSPEDRMGDILEKVAEYAALGVADIWVIDPRKRLGYYASSSGLLKSEDNVLRIAQSPIEISLDELFAEFDEI